MQAFWLSRQIVSRICDNWRLSHGVSVISRSINPRPHYQPKSFSSSADNGQGLIPRAVTKTP